MKDSSKLVVAILITVAVVCTSVSCTPVAGAETKAGLRSVTAIQQPYFALDYTSQLSSCECVTFDDVEDGTASGPFVGYLSGMYQMKGKYIPDREFSTAELRALGIWNLPGDRYQMLMNILFQLGTYYDVYGHLPVSGVDLFDELLTEEGSAAFAKMTAEEQLSQYFFGINTFTGKFRSTFQASEWSPGAISIEIISDPAVIATEFHGAKAVQVADDGEQLTIPAKSVWNVKVFGEEPESIILDYNWFKH